MWVSLKTRKPTKDELARRKKSEQDWAIERRIADVILEHDYIRIIADAVPMARSEHFGPAMHLAFREAEGG